MSFGRTAKAACIEDVDVIVLTTDRGSDVKHEVSIHGKKWDIHLVPQSKLTDYRRGEQSDGDCIVPVRPKHKLSRKERRIRIAKTLGDEDMLETLLHEGMHAAFPEKNEEWIQDTAEDLKNILWAFGYRRKGTDGE